MFVYLVRKVSLAILEHREMKNCPVKFSEKDKKEDVLWLHDVYVYPVYAQDEGPPKALRPHFKKGFFSDQGVRLFLTS